MKKTIQFDKRSLQFFMDGEGEDNPLLLLHGFCEDSSIWDALLQYLPKDRLVLRIDLPGFGGTALAPKPGLVHYADAPAAVLDFLQIETCHLVGHSMGGYTALEFLQHYPHRLSKLTLLHSHPYPDSEAAREKRLRGIDVLKAGKQKQYVSQLFPDLFPKEFAAANLSLVENLIARAKKFNPAGIIAALENMLDRRDHTATLAESPVPVQFIVGELDTLISEENAQAMCALPPVAEVHFLEKIGHMGMLEDPKLIAQLIGK